MAALLARLPHDEYRRLLPDLERVRLVAKQVLYDPGEAITHAWFPIDGVVSLLTVLGDGEAVETGVVGREGVVGLPLFLGAAGSPQRAVAQIAGEAWRLPAGAFLAAADAPGGRLPGLLRRYTHALLLLTAQEAACARRHPVGARCAQWLLLCADRTGTDRLALSTPSWRRCWACAGRPSPWPWARSSGPGWSPTAAAGSTSSTGPGWWPPPAPATASSRPTSAA